MTLPMTLPGRVPVDAVRLAPLAGEPTAVRCGCCLDWTNRAGAFGPRVDGHATCHRCLPNLIGAKAAEFVTHDLEQLAGRVAGLPRGPERQAAARLLFDAAHALLLSHGDTTADELNAA